MPDKDPKTQVRRCAEVTKDLPEMKLTTEDNLDRAIFRGKINSGGFQGEKLETNKIWTEERKNEHIEKIKEYCKTEEETKRRSPSRGPQLAETVRRRRKMMLVLQFD